LTRASIYEDLGGILLKTGLDKQNQPICFRRIDMSRVSTEIFTENFTTFIRTYEEQAIQCCIKTWNQFCSEYPIKSNYKITKKKRILSIGNDINIIDMANANGDISKISFSVDNRITMKSLRKNDDSPKIFVACRIWWNYDGYKVRGWLDHIEFDVSKDCITQFPQIRPIYPYWESQL
jgi:hypothetical protein